MPKQILEARTVSQVCIADGIFSLVLEAPSIAEEARPGQFISLYSRREDLLLPRPVSLCERFPSEGLIRLVYRIAGTGTKEFSLLKEGDPVRIMGPLGNGFSPAGERPVLIGGGIGIPPMLELAKAFGGSAVSVLGYRSERFLEDEFRKAGETVIATEDGSFGTKGTVLDAIREKGISGDGVYACGPLPMLRAVKAWAAGCGLPCRISLEERMACGVGACLACVCRTADVDEHSNVNNRRVCRDGPVFWAQEVEL